MLSFAIYYLSSFSPLTVKETLPAGSSYMSEIPGASVSLYPTIIRLITISLDYLLA